MAIASLSNQLQGSALPCPAHTPPHPTGNLGLEGQHILHRAHETGKDRTWCFHVDTRAQILPFHSIVLKGAGQRNHHRLGIKVQVCENLISKAGLSDRIEACFCFFGGGGCMYPTGPAQQGPGLATSAGRREKNLNLRTCLKSNPPISKEGPMNSLDSA